MSAVYFIFFPAFVQVRMMNCNIYNFKVLVQLHCFFLPELHWSSTIVSNPSMATTDTIFSNLLVSESKNFAAKRVFNTSVVLKIGIL